MSDEEFVNNYCPDGKVFFDVDIEKVYSQAEKEVKAIIEGILVEKYGDNVRTLEDRFNLLMEKAKMECVDLESEQIIEYKNARMDLMNMLKWTEVQVEF